MLIPRHTAYLKYGTLLFFMIETCPHICIARCIALVYNLDISNNNIKK